MRGRIATGVAFTPGISQSHAYHGTNTPVARCQAAGLHQRPLRQLYANQCRTTLGFDGADDPVVVRSRIGRGFQRNAFGT